MRFRYCCWKSDAVLPFCFNAVYNTGAASGECGSLTVRCSKLRSPKRKSHPEENLHFCSRQKTASVCGGVRFSSPASAGKEQTHHSNEGKKLHWTGVQNPLILIYHLQSFICIFISTRTRSRIAAFFCGTFPMVNLIKQPLKCVLAWLYQGDLELLLNVSSSIPQNWHPRGNRQYCFSWCGL